MKSESLTILCHARLHVQNLQEWFSLEIKFYEEEIFTHSSQQGKLVSFEVYEVLNY